MPAKSGRNTSAAAAALQQQQAAAAAAIAAAAAAGPPEPELSPVEKFARLKLSIDSERFEEAVKVDALQPNQQIYPTLLKQWQYSLAFLIPTFPPAPAGEQSQSNVENSQQFIQLTAKACDNTNGKRQRFTHISRNDLQTTARQYAVPKARARDASNCMQQYGQELFSSINETFSIASTNLSAVTELSTHALARLIKFKILMQRELDTIDEERRYNKLYHIKTDKNSMSLPYNANDTRQDSQQQPAAASAKPQGKQAAAKNKQPEPTLAAAAQDAGGAGFGTLAGDELIANNMDFIGDLRLKTRQEMQDELADNEQQALQSNNTGPQRFFILTGFTSSELISVLSKLHVYTHCVVKFSGNFIPLTNVEEERARASAGKEDKKPLLREKTLLDEKAKKKLKNQPPTKSGAGAGSDAKHVEISVKVEQENLQEKLKIFWASLTALFCRAHLTSPLRGLVVYTFEISHRVTDDTPLERLDEFGKQIFQQLVRTMHSLIEQHKNYWNYVQCLDIVEVPSADQAITRAITATNNLTLLNEIVTTVGLEGGRTPSPLTIVNAPETPAAASSSLPLKSISPASISGAVLPAARPSSTPPPGGGGKQHSTNTKASFNIDSNSNQSNSPTLISTPAPNTTVLSSPAEQHAAACAEAHNLIKSVAESGEAKNKIKTKVLQNIVQHLNEKLWQFSDCCDDEGAWWPSLPVQLRFVVEEVENLLASQAEAAAAAAVEGKLKKHKNSLEKLRQLASLTQKCGTLVDTDKLSVLEWLARVDDDSAKKDSTSSALLTPTKKNFELGTSRADEYNKSMFSDPITNLILCGRTKAEQKPFLHRDFRLKQACVEHLIKWFLVAGNSACLDSPISPLEYEFLLKKLTFYYLLRNRNSLELRCCEINDDANDSSCRVKNVPYDHPFKIFEPLPPTAPSPTEKTAENLKKKTDAEKTCKSEERVIEIHLEASQSIEKDSDSNQNIDEALNKQLQLQSAVNVPEQQKNGTKLALRHVDSLELITLPRHRRKLSSQPHQSVEAQQQQRKPTMTDPKSFNIITPTNPLGNVNSFHATRANSNNNNASLGLSPGISAALTRSLAVIRESNINASMEDAAENEQRLRKIESSFNPALRSRHNLGKNSRTAAAQRKEKSPPKIHVSSEKDGDDDDNDDDADSASKTPQIEEISGPIANLKLKPKFGVIKNPAAVASDLTRVRTLPLGRVKFRLELHNGDNVTVTAQYDLHKMHNILEPLVTSEAHEILNRNIMEPLQADELYRRLSDCARTYAKMIPYLCMRDKLLYLVFLNPHENFSSTKTKFFTTKWLQRLHCFTDFRTYFHHINTLLSPATMIALKAAAEVAAKSDAKTLSANFDNNSQKPAAAAAAADPKTLALGQNPSTEFNDVELHDPLINFVREYSLKHEQKLLQQQQEEEAAKLKLESEQKERASTAGAPAAAAATTAAGEQGAAAAAVDIKNVHFKKASLGAPQASAGGGVSSASLQPPPPRTSTNKQQLKSPAPSNSSRRPSSASAIEAPTTTTKPSQSTAAAPVLSPTTPAAQATRVAVSSATTPAPASVASGAPVSSTPLAATTPGAATTTKFHAYNSIGSLLHCGGQSKFLSTSFGLEVQIQQCRFFGQQPSSSNSSSSSSSSSDSTDADRVVVHFRAPSNDALITLSSPHRLAQRASTAKQLQQQTFICQIGASIKLSIQTTTSNSIDKMPTIYVHCENGIVLTVRRLQTLAAAAAEDDAKTLLPFCIEQSRINLSDAEKNNNEQQIRTSRERARLYLPHANIVRLLHDGGVSVWTADGRQIEAAPPPSPSLAPPTPFTTLDIADMASSKEASASSSSSKSRRMSTVSQQEKQHRRNSIAVGINKEASTSGGVPPPPTTETLLATTLFKQTRWKVTTCRGAAYNVHRNTVNTVCETADAKNVHNLVVQDPHRQHTTFLRRQDGLMHVENDDEREKIVQFSCDDTRITVKANEKAEENGAAGKFEHVLFESQSYLPVFYHAVLRTYLTRFLDKKNNSTMHIDLLSSQNGYHCFVLAKNAALVVLKSGESRYVLLEDAYFCDEAARKFAMQRISNVTPNFVTPLYSKDADEEEGKNFFSACAKKSRKKNSCQYPRNTDELEQQLQSARRHASYSELLNFYLPLMYFIEQKLLLPVVDANECSSYSGVNFTRTSKNDNFLSTILVNDNVSQEFYSISVNSGKVDKRQQLENATNTGSRQAKLRAQNNRNQMSGRYFLISPEKSSGFELLPSRLSSTTESNTSNTEISGINFESFLRQNKMYKNCGMFGRFNTERQRKKQKKQSRNSATNSATDKNLFDNEICITIPQKLNNSTNHIRFTTELHCAQAKVDDNQTQNRDYENTDNLIPPNLRSELQTPFYYIDDKKFTTPSKSVNRFSSSKGKYDRRKSHRTRAKKQLRDIETLKKLAAAQFEIFETASDNTSTSLKLQKFITFRFKDELSLLRHMQQRLTDFAKWLHFNIEPPYGVWTANNRKSLPSNGEQMKTSIINPCPSVESYFAQQEPENKYPTDEKREEKFSLTLPPPSKPSQTATKLNSLLDFFDLPPPSVLATDLTDLNKSDATDSSTSVNARLSAVQHALDANVWPHPVPAYDNNNNTTNQQQVALRRRFVEIVRNSLDAQFERYRVRQAHAHEQHAVHLAYVQRRMHQSRAHIQRRPLPPAPAPAEKSESGHKSSNNTRYDSQERSEAFNALLFHKTPKYFGSAVGYRLTANDSRFEKDKAEELARMKNKTKDPKSTLEVSKQNSKFFTSDIRIKSARQQRAAATGATNSAGESVPSDAQSRTNNQAPRTAEQQQGEVSIPQSSTNVEGVPAPIGNTNTHRNSSVIPDGVSFNFGRVDAGHTKSIVRSFVNNEANSANRLEVKILNKLYGEPTDNKTVTVNSSSTAADGEKGSGDSCSTVQRALDGDIILTHANPLSMHIWQASTSDRRTRTDSGSSTGSNSSVWKVQLTFVAPKLSVLEHNYTSWLQVATESGPIMVSIHAIIVNSDMKTSGV